MRRIVCSIGVLGLMSVTVCAMTQAAPIAPVASTAAGSTNNIPVHYYHYYRHRYWQHGYPLAAYWNYYRTDWPGRGNSVESTR